MTPTARDPEVTSARRVMAQHRRRRHPDRHRCGYCGEPWRTAETRTGVTVKGCTRRRRAMSVLAAAGHLDELGRLRLPASVVPA